MHHITILELVAVLRNLCAFLPRGSSVAYVGVDVKTFCNVDDLMVRNGLLHNLEKILAIVLIKRVLLFSLRFIFGIGFVFDLRIVIQNLAFRGSRGQHGLDWSAKPCRCRQKAACGCLQLY